MTLSVNTPIPTAYRGQVRAFIKGQGGFASWLMACHGVAESRKASNAHLLEYAIYAGLEAQVEAIMQGAPTIYTPQVIADNAQEDENVEAALRSAEKHFGKKTGFDPNPIVSGSSDIASILSPVEPFLSPLVKSELEKALAPLVAAANKPAQTIEVEKIVYQTITQAPLPAGATPYAQPLNKASLGSIFGFRGKYASAPITLWDSHGAAPAIDPFYVVDPYHMFVLATAIERGSNVWQGGPSGSGKSTAPEQFCAHVNRPCVTFNLDKQTRVEDLLGGPAVLADGSTAWQDGALIQAVKRPGTVIVLDELSSTPPGVQFVFHSLAGESRSYVLPTGERVTCAQGVVFIVADNTMGYGDETGKYGGTHACNAALVNRFKRVIKVDYMDKAQEAKALANHTGAPKPACDSLADFVARARKMPEMENVPLSLRQMTGFIQCIQDGLAPKQAAQLSFLNMLPGAERAALETLFTLAWAQEFGALMSGTALDPLNPSGPSNSPASQAFDDEVSASIVR